ncbi:MAG: methylated-DNA--[protein]-cysteine S-methyltransferase [Gammaproteobacteria bacterium]|nr:methylated-DNA--[protein]-cysteine S-methyltransferase [Gammaproteobacteria bacterium]
MSDYDRIAKAIDFINQRVSQQPALEEIAAHVHLSPFHFQRLFSRWAGVSPKRFLQVLTLERGKQLLAHNDAVLAVADSLGLSSASRLYDHFVQLEAVTPGDYKQQGKGLHIEYGCHATPFGTLFIAVSDRGVCRAAFLDHSSLQQEIAELQHCWPLATISANATRTAEVVAGMFGHSAQRNGPLSLYVKGTNFQVTVWRALLQIPAGSVLNYKQLATQLGRPRSARAVGNAIAANPIAYLIPCHRVIQQTGAIGKYHWGPIRKQAIQVWEKAQSGKAG